MLIHVYLNIPVFICMGQIEKLEFDIGLTCLVFSLEGTLNTVVFYLKYFNAYFGS